jgi:hypothetical protein
MPQIQHPKLTRKTKKSPACPLTTGLPSDCVLAQSFASCDSVEAYTVVHANAALLC